MILRVWPAPNVAETTLPPPDVSDTFENVHPSISASASDVREISGDEMLATDVGVSVIWMRVTEPPVAEKSDCSSATELATPVRQKVMEMNVTLGVEQTKMSPEMELTNLMALLSLDG